MKLDVTEHCLDRRQFTRGIPGLESRKRLLEREPQRARHDGMPRWIRTDKPADDVVGDGVVCRPPDSMHEYIGDKEPRHERRHDRPRPQPDRMLLHPRQRIDPFRRRRIGHDRQFDAERIHVGERQHPRSRCVGKHPPPPRIVS